MLGTRRHREIKDLLKQHLTLVGEAVRELETMVENYLAGDHAFKAHSRQIDSFERQADTARRAVERKLFEGGVLPVYREDYLGLLHAADRVANKAEGAGDTLTLIRPPFPESVVPKVAEMAAVTRQAWELVPALVERVLAGETEVSEGVRTIRECESRIDKLQFDATRLAYKDDAVDRTVPLQVLLTLERLAGVSDQIENVADQLDLIAIRRKLA